MDIKFTMANGSSVVQSNGQLKLHVASSRLQLIKCLMCVADDRCISVQILRILVVLNLMTQELLTCFLEILFDVLPLPTSAFLCFLAFRNQNISFLIFLPVLYCLLTSSYLYCYQPSMFNLLMILALKQLRATFSQGCDFGF